MDRLGIIVIQLNYEGSDINMNRLGSLITQLESTEKYDKENLKHEKTDRKSDRFHFGRAF